MRKYINKLHEIKGRMRIHICQKRMTFKEADILEYYLSIQKQITAVKVYERNQDAWLMPETLGLLIDAMESVRAIGIICPMQMTADMERPDYRFEKWCPRRALKDVQRRRSGKVYDVDFVMAAHWLISRECLENVG